jgi:hypothetical protein
MDATTRRWNKLMNGIKGMVVSLETLPAGTVICVVMTWDQKLDVVKIKNAISTTSHDILKILDNTSKLPVKIILFL